MTDAQVLDKLRTILAEAFELEHAQIEPGSHLFDDLDLDSIDAVDLAIKLQEMTGKRIKPEAFKHVRTVGDVIAMVHSLHAETV
jgi:acyl carrier protein